MQPTERLSNKIIYLISIHQSYLNHFFIYHVVIILIVKNSIQNKKN